MRSNASFRSSERGSAPVEFVMTGVLLVTVTLTVLQIAFVAHLKAIAIDSAIAGAARAALADTTRSEGILRTRRLLESSIPADLIRGVAIEDSMLGAQPIVTITVDLGIPAIGPWLPVGTVAVSGRAFRELR